VIPAPIMPAVVRRAQLPTDDGDGVAVAVAVAVAQEQHLAETTATEAVAYGRPPGHAAVGRVRRHVAKPWPQWDCR